MLREPVRVMKLRQRSKKFLEQAMSAGIPMGSSAGLAVIPAITASSIKAAQLSKELAGKGVSVQPILYPAVPEKAARLRFFISSDHSENDVIFTVAALKEAWNTL
jgi:8-amino-7-oxononanoate synthase